MRVHGSIRDGTRSDGGFTLPELLVVVGIIAILAAIAVPTFLGAKTGGQDGHAQANLRSGLSAQRTYYVDFQTYTTDAVALRKIEPNINWATTEAEAEGVMAALSGTQVVVLVSGSESGNQFCLMHIAADQTMAVNGQTLAGTYYKKNPVEVDPPSTSVTVGQCGASGYQRTKAGWN